MTHWNFKSILISLTHFCTFTSTLQQCRTLCGWFVTEEEHNAKHAELVATSEPEDINYHRVFEMEKKKRQLLVKGNNIRSPSPKSQELAVPLA